MGNSVVDIGVCVAVLILYWGCGSVDTGVGVWELEYWGGGQAMWTF